jgi:hypothetical protein
VDFVKPGAVVAVARWAENGISDGRAGPKPGPVISSGAQVARLVAGSLQALGPAAPMAFTRNQYSVPLVRPVTVHFDALPT